MLMLEGSSAEVGPSPGWCCAELAKTPFELANPLQPPFFSLPDSRNKIRARAALARLEAEHARLDAEAKARLEAEEKARLEAEEKARLEAEEKARFEAEGLAKAMATLEGPNRNPTEEIVEITGVSAEVVHELRGGRQPEMPAAPKGTQPPDPSTPKVEGSDERERATRIILNRFAAQPELGEASAEDIERADVGWESESNHGTVWFVRVETDGPRHAGGGKKAVIANLRLGEAFLTQMGFHMTYWELGGPKALGPPTSDERGTGAGAIQNFEGGDMFWTPDKGLYVELKEGERREAGTGSAQPL